MGQLVADHRGHPLLIVGGTLPGVVEQRGLPVRDEAPMFHGTADKVRNGDHVLLGQRIRDPEVILEEVGDVGANLQRVAHPASR